MLHNQTFSGIQTTRLFHLCFAKVSPFNITQPISPQNSTCNYCEPTNTLFHADVKLSCCKINHTSKYDSTSLMLM